MAQIMFTNNKPIEMTIFFRIIYWIVFGISTSLKYLVFSILSSLNIEMNLTSRFDEKLFKIWNEFLFSSSSKY
jgi:hypothetical protein